ncbi:proline-rich protein 36-like [Gopherus evgoodei]|uniref:proline-rich protein 36-like n=1 Tax=Gopherus evgoodei TaxID=1825980 RepID=UPI0011CFC67D|nr:proline-rich protein 36-like [Gopherus evgoodei]
MPHSDGHSQCVKCLGDTNIPAKCFHCASLKSRARRDRDMRLKIIMMEKSLQPLSETGKVEPAPTRSPARSELVRSIASPSLEWRQEVQQSHRRDSNKGRGSLVRSLTPVLTARKTAVSASPNASGTTLAELRGREQTSRAGKASTDSVPSALQTTAARTTHSSSAPRKATAPAPRSSSAPTTAAVPAALSAQTPRMATALTAWSVSALKVAAVPPARSASAIKIAAVPTVLSSSAPRRGSALSHSSARTPAADPLQGTSRFNTAGHSLPLSPTKELVQRADIDQPRDQEQQLLTQSDLLVPPEPHSPLPDTEDSFLDLPLSPPELAFTDGDLELQQQAEFSPPASPPQVPLPPQVTAQAQQPQFPYVAPPWAVPGFSYPMPWPQ